MFALWWAPNNTILLLQKQQWVRTARRQNKEANRMKKRQVMSCITGQPWSEAHGYHRWRYNFDLDSCRVLRTNHQAMCLGHSGNANTSMPP